MTIARETVSAATMSRAAASSGALVTVMPASSSAVVRAAPTPAAGPLASFTRAALTSGVSPSRRMKVRSPVMTIGAMNRSARLG